jgi:hypothetical protein
MKFTIAIFTLIAAVSAYSFEEHNGVFCSALHIRTFDPC